MFKDATSSESEDLLRTAEPNERINFLASAQRQYDDADDSDDNNETVAEEGVRGWLVVFASFICIAVLDGVGYTTGLLLNSLLADLGGSRAEVSITGSLQVGIYCLSGPLVGRLVTEFGTRYVCMAGALVACLGMILASFGQSLGAVLVGYSGFAGVGFGLMYIPSVVGAAPFFNKRRSLAIGICLCGSGIGTFTLAPICEAILSRYGWRWVFRTFGALCLVCFFCGILMFSPTQDDEEEGEGEEKQAKGEKEKYKAEEDEEEDEEEDNFKESSVEQLRAPYRVMSPTLFNNPNFPTFLICLLADFMAFTGIYIPYTHLPPLAEFRNISSTDAAFLISAGGISNTFGRFLGGWLCDQPAIHPFLVTILSVGLTIIPSFIIPRIVAYRSFISMFSVFGLATGCTMGSTSPLLLRLLGLKALSQTFGLITASRGIAALVGPPLAGLLVDLLDEPGIAIDLVGFLEILALFFYIIAVGRNRVVQRRRNYQQL